MVRLVEHGDLDVAQVAVALLDEVGQPSRTGDDDVGTVTQGGHLRALRGAAEDRRDAEAHGPGQRLEHLPDLAGEFAGRQEHQAARTAGHGVAVGESRDERERIAERLTGTGAALPENVVPGECVGQRDDLDRERCGDASRGERRDERRRDSE